MPRVSIIIVSYNVKYYIEQCLRSVVVAGQDMDYEVWVVDNASTDNTVTYLKKVFPPKQFPHIHVIGNRVNLGFGRANNQMLQYCTGEYVLFLNPDTVLTEKTLKDFLSFYETHENAGAVGARMLHVDGTFALESRRGLPTPFTAFCKLLGLTRLFPKSRLFGRYYLQYLDDSDVCEIEIVSGACMMVPKPVLDKTGGFDKQFFMYGEDIDLSYRIQQAGYQNYYIPTPILHYKGESTEKSSFRYVHVFYDAMLLFFNKHFKKSYMLLSIPVRLAIYVIALHSLLAKKAETWRTWLKPAKNNDMNYLFIGKRSHFSVVKKLASQWSLSIQCVAGDFNSLPDGHNSPDIETRKFQCVIYDVDAFPMKNILANFEISKYNEIGLFHAQKKLITTSNKVFVL